MINRIEWEMVSRRRMFSLLGVALALGLAVPSTDAEAQTPNAGTPTPSGETPTPSGGTPGMQRRQKRRQGRVQRRYERRGGQPASTQPATNAPAPSEPTQKQ